MARLVAGLSLLLFVVPSVLAQNPPSSDLQGLALATTSGTVIGNATWIAELDIECGKFTLLAKGYRERAGLTFL